MLITSPPQKNNQMPHRIAGVHNSGHSHKSGGGGRDNRGKVKIEPKTGVKLRFHKRNEWQK